MDGPKLPDTTNELEHLDLDEWVDDLLEKALSKALGERYEVNCCVFMSDLGGVVDIRLEVGVSRQAEDLERITLFNDEYSLYFTRVRTLVADIAAALEIPETEIRL